MSTDSFSYGGQYTNTCYNVIPANGNTYQYPKTGSAYILTGFYWLNNARGYLMNRLKQNLISGKTYCVKLYVNNTNTSTYAIDSYGIYFGSSGIDTIKKCNIPLTYIIPQVKNAPGNIITDTMNWVPITGTFVANGTEKYALIGNFKSDAATNTLLINPTNLPLIFADVCIDDVSCIDLDLDAFAGNDTSCIPGSTIYLGRMRDVGIDEACTWYQLPNMQTALDTAAGIWVSPIVTSTYVVRQEICGNVKWDTVVVCQTAVGINEFIFLNENLKIYPVPADDILELKFDASKGAAEKLFEDFKRLSIYNNLGQVLRTEELNFKEKTLSIDIRDLDAGVYFLTIENNNAQTMPSGTQSTLRQASFSKRFIIQR